MTAPRTCPICGKPVLDFDLHPQEPPFCSPLQSPGCWRVEQTYDKSLRRWVMTHEPGEEAPTASEYRKARRT